MYYTQPPAPQHQSQGFSNKPLSAFSAPFFAPGSNQQLPQWFASVDTDRSGKISVVELQRVLQQQGLPFSLKFCNGLIRLYDKAQESSLRYEEFCGVHQLFSTILQNFRAADSNQDGQLTIGEVENLVRAAGFALDQQAFYQACKAFDIEKSGFFDLAEYIGLYVFLSNSRAMFAAFDSQKQGTVTLDFSKFVYAASGTS
eukprot:CAMPEP_0196571960 /NCGR_PEP_ID=MMETSP1081-20130531/2092_1 /TAXON_ID=36882 /ORGANISM="Pyramimonas amylifera, Strain CCMP720" /LENGTH=199 /DNA_ID=CAMNT_0041889109 /DNA_START=33 /DNA_END=632 /DNA_ORIENTATION=+